MGWRKGQNETGVMEKEKGIVWKKILIHEGLAFDLFL